MGVMSVAAEPSPAFQFYPRDFLASSTVRLMSMEARGVYISLLATSWLDGALPTNLASLAKLVGISTRTFAKLWPNIAPAFTLTDAGYVSARLEVERKKQRDYQARSSEKGKKGAHARWHGHPSGNAQPMPTENATGISQALPADGFSFSSSDLISQIASPIPVVVPPTSFDVFWTAYPRKVGKDAARKAWTQKKPPLQTVLDALAWQSVSDAWTKDGGSYIPHPATYLRQGRWQDERPVTGRWFAPSSDAAVFVFVDPCPHDPSCEDGRARCRTRQEIAWAKAHPEAL